MIHVVPIILKDELILGNRAKTARRLAVNSMVELLFCLTKEREAQEGPTRKKNGKRATPRRYMDLFVNDSTYIPRTIQANQNVIFKSSHRKRAPNFLSHT